MIKSVGRFLSFVLLVALTLPASAHDDDDRGGLGAVYTMSNAASGNEVLIYERRKTGALKSAGAVATGGLGTGGGLGNQGGLILDPANRWLFAVNAASDDVSVFAVEEDGLSLVDVEFSNGVRPVSLTVHDDLLYVLNAGSDEITGFRVGADGSLAPLPGSTRPLSGASTGPAQVQFNTDGNVLVVTEKATNRIVTFTVDADGYASGPMVHDSVGATPFGFAFGKRDILLVSEAAGGAEDASSVSSYRVSGDGGLDVIEGGVATTETAACWVVVSSDGRFAYTTNTGSGSLSGYRVGFGGELSLLRRNGVSGRTGRDSGPIDMALSNDARNLYTLNAGNHSISAFRLGARGQLERLRSQKGLPPGANGLAAR